MLNLELTTDQKLLFDTTTRFLKKRWPIEQVRRYIEDPAASNQASIWREAAELGWTSLLGQPIDVGNGVAEDGATNLAVVAEAIGGALFPAPLIPTNIVAFSLLRWGSGDEQCRLLDALLDGTEIATWAVAEDDCWGQDAQHATASVTRDGYRLDGVKSPVEFADEAHHLLIAARTPKGLTQFVVPADVAGLSRTPLQSLDPTRRFSRVEMRGVHVASTSVVGDVGTAEHAVESELALAVALQCAETIGAAERIYEMTVSYVKERKSFGRPIGSYQALKHRLADMLLWLESAKAVTVAAINAVTAVDAGSVPASLAKAYVGYRCPSIVRECLQLHGGIGFTWEHDAHLYLRRVESNAAIFGDTDYHSERLSRQAVFASTTQPQPS